MTEKDILDKYLGAPFKHMGTDPKTGIDCWQFIKLVYKDLGINLLDIGDYPEDWAKKGLNYFLSNYHAQWMQVDPGRFLDVVLFRNNGIVDHAGIALNGNRFIHCCKAGVVIGTFNDARWKYKLAGYYRLRQ